MAGMNTSPVASVAKRRKPRRRPRRGGSKPIPESRPIPNAGQGDIPDYSRQPMAASVRPPVATVAKKRKPRRRRKPRVTPYDPSRQGLYGDGSRGIYSDDPVPAAYMSRTTTGGAAPPRGSGRASVPPRKKPSVGKKRTVATLEGRRKPSKSRRNPQKMSWSQQMRQPFNPLATPYRTYGDFERAARSLAYQQYGPQMEDLRAQIGEAQSANLGRRQDIAQYTTGLTNNLQRSYDETNRALQGLLGTYTAGNQASQQGLAAILAASDAAGVNRAGNVAMPAPASASGQVNTAVPTLPGAAGNTLAQIFASQIGAASQRQSLGALMARESYDQEATRFRNVLGGLQDQRSSLTANIPQYRQNARQELWKQALAGQNQGFQQNLARRQFGLAAQNQRFQQNLANRQFGLSEKQFRLAQQQFGLERLKFQHAKNIDWANVTLEGRKFQESVRQFDAQLEQARAENASRERIAAIEQRRRDAAAKGARYDAAVNGLAKYLEPNRMEQKRPRRYRRYFEDALRLLQGQYRLDYKTALQLLGSTTFQSWQNRSQRLLNGNLPPGTRDPAPNRRGGR